MVRSNRGSTAASLDEAIASLTHAAGVIDGLCATSSPSVEFLDASLAVHKALVALVDSGPAPQPAVSLGAP